MQIPTALTFCKPFITRLTVLAGNITVMILWGLLSDIYCLAVAFCLLPDK